MKAELEKIDEEVVEDENNENDIYDKPEFSIPSTDDGFRKILKERFGFDDFLEG